MNLSENAKKYLGYGLIATGVAVGGYAVYSISQKKKAAPKPKPALNGTGTGTGKRKRNKKKQNKKISLK